MKNFIDEITFFHGPQNGRPNRYLSGNELHDLQDGSFSGLPALRFLWLDRNALSRVPTSSLTHLTELEAL